MTNSEENNSEKKKIANSDVAFADPDVRSLFHFLCKKWIGDTFSIEFLTRTEWGKKGSAIFEKKENGKEILFIPEDVESEELVEILEIAGKPKNERTTRRLIESPRNELASFLFQKGAKMLIGNMGFDSLRREVKNALLSWKHGETTLCEALLLDSLRSELEEVKKTGNADLIAEKEIEIADKVQMVIRGYPFLSSSQHPAEMIKNKSINCRGASVLGGAILSEIGISYLVGDVPRHSILILVLSNDTVEWRDMLNPMHNEFITDDVIRGYSKTGSQMTLADVLAYAKDPTPDGLMLDIAGDEYRKKLPWVKEGRRQFLTLFPPKLGSQMQILNGIAFSLAELAYKETTIAGRNEYFNQAVEACKLSTAYEPKYEYAYNTMGESLCRLEKYEEAIESYQRSFSINPWNTSCHYGLGEANFALGRKKEALSSYRKYVELADPRPEDQWVKKAEKKIALILKELKSREN